MYFSLFLKTPNARIIDFILCRYRCDTSMFLRSTHDVPTTYYSQFYMQILEPDPPTKNPRLTEGKHIFREVKGFKSEEDTCLA